MLFLNRNRKLSEYCSGKIVFPETHESIVSHWLAGHGQDHGFLFEYFRVLCFFFAIHSLVTYTTLPSLRGTGV